jgi:hypothetical protein
LNTTIGLLRDAHGWEFRDAHELEAPVDYHEIRGHLRVGTVIIADGGLNARIGTGNVTSDEDNLVRAAVGDAISAIAADLPNHDPLQVHYILWNFFRAICRREVPACCSGGGFRSMNWTRHIRNHLPGPKPAIPVDFPRFV